MEGWKDAVCQLVALMDEKTHVMVHTAKTAAGTLKAPPSKYPSVSMSKQSRCPATAPQITQAGGTSSCSEGRHLLLTLPLGMGEWGTIFKPIYP